MRRLPATTAILTINVTTSRRHASAERKVDVISYSNTSEGSGVTSNAGVRGGGRGHAVFGCQAFRSRKSIRRCAPGVHLPVLVTLATNGLLTLGAGTLAALSFTSGDGTHPPRRRDRTISSPTIRRHHSTMAADGRPATAIPPRTLSLTTLRRTDLCRRRKADNCLHRHASRLNSAGTASYTGAAILQRVNVDGDRRQRHRRRHHSDLSFGAATRDTSTSMRSTSPPHSGGTRSSPLRWVDIGSRGPALQRRKPG